jgi:TRAP-type C4-dicarboxylate transport system substrate-binding protein
MNIDMFNILREELRLTLKKILSESGKEESKEIDEDEKLYKEKIERL